MVSKQAPWSEKSLPDQAGIAPTSEGESGVQCAAAKVLKTPP
jgi:hypothetical protein